MNGISGWREYYAYFQATKKQMKSGEKDVRRWMVPVLICTNR
jgi:hypothetical protein